MDELDLLTQNRPAPPPMTVAERAAIEEQLMTHIDEATTTRDDGAPPVLIDVGAPPRRNRRVLRIAGLVGAAAALAVVALAVGTTGSGPAPLQAEPTAAEQLVALADVVEASNPYPAGAYGVPSHQWDGTDRKSVV